MYNPKTMFILRQHRKRLELLLMLLVGLIWGILLSQLLHQAHFQFSDIDNSLITSQNPDEVSSSSSTSNSLSHTMDHFLSYKDVISMNDNESMKERRYNETRVLCMILTSPKTHQTRAIHIKRTWGNRCNKIIFMSSQPDNVLDTVPLKVKDGSSNLWGKMRASLQYVYKHYYHEYDWYLKANDDTYVVLENLRTFLNAHSPGIPVYFGAKLQTDVTQDYVTGGAGYVLSKEALHRFMTLGFHNSSICNNQIYGTEDIELGRCLQNVGVLAGESRDELGLSRFIPSSNYQKMPTSNITNSDCCSQSAIAFHSNNARDFYVLDYVIYRLRPLGLFTPHAEFPANRLVLQDNETHKT